MSQRNNILQELKELESKLVDFPVNLPYTVPQGYFDNLAHIVLKRIKAEDTVTVDNELDNLSPLLKSIPKAMPYQVPPGYFENEISTPKAKIVSFGRSKVFRYVAAAVTAGLILLASLYYFGPVTRERNAEKVLVKLTSDIGAMTETEKNSMIDYIDAGLNGKETVQAATQLAEVKELLMDVSEEELKLFREQSEDIEDVLMIN